MKKNIFLILLLLSFEKIANATTIGSDSAVTLFTNQVTLGSGDRIAAFAAIEGGCLLATSTVSATFDSLFQISGVVNLNGGNLILTRDLRFTDTTGALRNFGTITGNGHTLTIAPTMTCIPDMSPTGTVVIPTNCNSSLKFSLNVGGGHDFLSSDWSFDSNYFVGGVSDNPDRLDLWSWNGSSLTALQEITYASNTQLQLVRWHPSAYFLAVCFLRGAAKELIIYQFTPGPNTLTEISSLTLGAATDIYSLAWSPNGNFLITGQNVAGSELIVYSVTAGVINPVPVSTVDLPGTRVVGNKGLMVNNAGTFLAVGLLKDGVNFELLVYAFNSGTGVISALPNAAHFFNVNVNAVDWNSVSASLIAVGLGGTANSLQLWLHNSGAGTLTNTQLVNPGNNTVESVDFRPDGQCLGIGTNNGHAIFYSFNSGTNMVTQTFDDNEGGITTDLRYSPNSLFAGTGNHNHFVYIYLAGTGGGIGGAGACGNISNIVMILQDNLCLNADQCITFSGNCFIKGNNKCFILEPGSEILIAPNSSLTFEDVTMQNVANNISCVDNTGQMIFQNTTWQLESNFTFTLGKFTVNKDFRVVGEDLIFAYQTTLTSQVLSNARFILDELVTFSYAPITANQDLVSLVDATAQLILRGATLHSTTTGLRLTKGQLVVENQSFISSEATMISQAMSFGDGINSFNDLTIHFEPAATLELVRGFALYNNSAAEGEF